MIIMSLIMAPTLAAIFHASGPLGPNWLDSSRFPLSDNDLHCLVVTASRYLTAPKAHQLYGHCWMTRSAMARTVSRYYQER